MNALHNKTTLTVRDLTIDMKIGIYDEEKEREQPVILTIEAVLPERSSDTFLFDDKIENTLSYELLIEHTRRIAGLRHYNLVETLGETLCDYFLKTYQLESVSIGIQKPEIIEDAVVGVTMTRHASLSQ